MKIEEKLSEIDNGNVRK